MGEMWNPQKRLELRRTTRVHSLITHFMIWIPPRERSGNTNKTQCIKCGIHKESKISNSGNFHFKRASKSSYQQIAATWKYTSSLLCDVNSLIFITLQVRNSWELQPYTKVLDMCNSFPTCLVLIQLIQILCFFNSVITDHVKNWYGYL